ncbi:MAG: hypothetical protein WCC00_12390 [Candidatus Aminicenantales bacterium]
MARNFIAKIADENWPLLNQRSGRKTFTFKKRLNDLNDRELEYLIKAYFVCAEYPKPDKVGLSQILITLKRKRKYKKLGQEVSYKILEGFLYLITLSEYMLDDYLLDMPTFRKNFIRETKRIGIDTELLINIYLNWDEHYADKVFPTGEKAWE